MERYILEHPEKRNEYRKRNYQQTQNAPNHRKPWTTKEIEYVLRHDLIDRELSKILGRSVQSIQVVRCRAIKRRENDSK